MSNSHLFKSQNKIQSIIYKKVNHKLRLKKPIKIVNNLKTWIINNKHKIVLVYQKVRPLFYLALRIHFKHLKQHHQIKNNI